MKTEHLITGDTDHEQGRTDISFDRGYSRSAYPDLDANQTNGDDDDFSDFDADDPGSLEECVLVGLLGFEDDHQLSQGLANALDHAAAHHVSKSKARQTGLAKRAAITEEDFEEGAPRNAYTIIRSQASNLFSRDPKMFKRRPKAIDFFFTNLDNGEDATFQLCCDVLDTRPDVLRLRIAYEFWLRGIQFTNPMPFETVPVPDVIVNEVYMLCGDTGLAVAQAVWNRPGVDSTTIIQRCVYLGHAQSDVEKAMTRIRDEFILSEFMNGWYLTGRNPIMQSMRDQTRFGGKMVPMITQTIHWSRLF